MREMTGDAPVCTRDPRACRTRKRQQQKLHSAWHYTQELCHANSYNPSRKEPSDGTAGVKTHSEVPPSVRRHRRPVLPHRSCVTACALPMTGDFGSEVTSTALRQVHTARQPFRRCVNAYGNQPRLQTGRDCLAAHGSPRTTVSELSLRTPQEFPLLFYSGHSPPQRLFTARLLLPPR